MSKNKSAEPYPEVGSLGRVLLLAAPRSLCAGVERAIETVGQLLETNGAPVYVRRQIVHNTYVVEKLRSRGAIFVEELDEVPDGACVVFSAHGVAPSVRQEGRRRALTTVDATCPLVSKVHAEARRYADRGDTVLLIGHADHEEVVGTMGEAPPGKITLVESIGDAENVVVDHPEQVSYLTQTTLSVDETRQIVDALRRRFPALKGPPDEDICYATTNRQNALAAVAREADVVLVVGSQNSSNSVRLVEVSRTLGTPAYLIENARRIKTSWLRNASIIGLSAGASAPPDLVDEVIARLRNMGPLEIQERRVATETEHFLPSIGSRVRDRRNNGRAN
jgi:4-hydroxy-3-methylbut-2-en-1-yl diphosphate reductase